MKKILKIILIGNLLFMLSCMEPNVSNVNLKLFTKTNKTHPVDLTEEFAIKEIEGFCSHDNCTNYIIIHGYRVIFQIKKRYYYKITIPKIIFLKSQVQIVSG
jgi:hypothetical protein